MKTKEYINVLLENGIHFNTISKMNKNQIKVLAERFETKEDWQKNVSQEVTYTTPISSVSGGKGVQVPPPTDPSKKTMVSVTGGNLKVTQAEGEMTEKFESKAQQKLFYAKCGDGKTKEQKKWCKMKDEFEASTSKKDYKKMPEKLHPEKTVKYKKKTNENFEKFLEDKIVNMLDEYINPSMTKGDFLKTLNEKKESMILKRPKKMSMFSDEEGIEMKKPIGKITSLGMTENSTKEKQAPTKPGIKNPPKRKNPFKDPNPGVKENPKADKEKQKSEFMSAIMQVLSV
jgi:hypothetical protein